MVADEIEIILGLLVVAAALAWMAARLKVPYPILMVLGGLAIGFVPRLPRISLEPDYVFVLFLPPLLYFAGLMTTWRDFRANLRPISMLAIGLVLATTATIAVIAHWVIPGMTWPAAFVLGAIVSPPDAVAAVSIMRRLRVPRRVQVILEGESLVNDATALVAYRFAIAAAVIGPFSFSSAAGRFVVAAAGGVIVGYLAGVIVAWVRPKLHDSGVESVVSLLTPWIAYLPAEWLGVSGVLSVVTTGIYLSRRLPHIVSSGMRLRMTAVWETLVFLLNGLIFILIGLQLPVIVGNLSDFKYSTLVWYGLLISMVAVVVRMIWVFGATYLPRLLIPALRRRDPIPPFGSVCLVAWTGMRGIVSLAAALALPMTLADGKSPFPARDLILFITFCVILFTLVVQGLTLPGLIRLLGMRQENAEAHEEALARREVAHAALARLEGLAFVNEEAIDRINRVRQPYHDRVRYFARRTREIRNESEDAETEICTSLVSIQREAIATERLMLVKLRDDGVIGDEVMRRIQKELDLEESRLSGEDEI
jgi:CPA1 family monovalent cation:H+ antiporter